MEGNDTMILLFLLWLILNGRFTADAGMLQIVITGLLLIAAVAWFSKKVLGYSVKAELRFYAKLPLLLAYVLLLIKEIIKASLSMLGLIVTNKAYDPVIVRFTVPLKSRFTQVILANSITLTPGTITAELEDDTFTVHCIDASLAEGLESCSFVKLLERIEK